MGWTTRYASRPAFAADPASITRDPGGRQVDWDYVDDSYRLDAETISVNGAVAAGATSITVDALPVPLLAGTMLNFGSYAPVTVTVADSSVSAGDTTLLVAALSGPIPAGTVLDFSAGTNAQLAKLSADAAAGATSLTVYPLDGTIANTQTALFPGGTKQARVTANAALGATSLTVDELQFAIADNATATFGGTKGKVIQAGTVMCELSGGKICPRAARPGSETAIGLLETPAEQDSKTDALSGYGLVIGGAVFENLLPEASGSPAVISSTYKTELQAAGVGTGFAWRQYADNTGS